MSHVLTETGTPVYSPTITVPDDGDAEVAASVITPLDALAKRTRFLQQIMQVSGVTKVRTVADVPTMKALTGNSDGDVVMLLNGGGIYIFVSSATDTPTSALTAEYFVVPTSGGGRWWSIVYFWTNNVGGFPRWFIPVPNAIVVPPTKTSFTTGGNPSTSLSGAFQPVTGMRSNNASVQTGDLVRVKCTGTLLSSGQASAPDKVALYAYDGTTTTQLAETAADVGVNGTTAAVYAPFALETVFTAAGAGTLQFLLYTQGSSGGTNTVILPVNFVVEVVRP